MNDHTVYTIYYLITLNQTALNYLEMGYEGLKFISFFSLNVYLLPH